MTQTPRPPGLLRRLGAVLYDVLAVFAVVFVADALVIVPLGMLFEIKDLGQHPLFQLYQMAIIVAFYLWFWTHGGQTLGLRAWHLRVVREDGSGLKAKDAVKRLVLALLSWLPLGLGFLWVVFDKQKLAWHDKLSHTKLVFTKD